MIDKKYINSKLEEYNKQLGQAIQQQEQWKIKAIRLDAMMSELKEQLNDLSGSKVNGAPAKEKSN